MKKVAIIGTVGLPAKYGGFETLASHIVTNLSDNYNFSVYCSGKSYKKTERQSTFQKAKLIYLPFKANGMQSIIYDSLSIIHAVFYADVLIVLGVAGAWTFPFVRLFTNKKIIVSIDGIEWKRDKWSRLAKIYLWVAEKIAVKYSHIDISDNESIQDYTAMRYGTLSRIIEYGGDHVKQVESTKEDHEKYPFLKQPYSVKVCRIEPENNVHLILEAFSKMNDRTLVIVGNWDNSEYGRNLKKTYSGYSTIHLLDPIYDQRTIDLIRGHAILYIHGHSAGGTNPSLVEAMNLNLPVLAYRVSYNKTTTENKASYFSTVEEIVDFMKKLTTQKLKENATNMKQIAQRRYKWQIIAHKYNLLIEEALAAEPKLSVKSHLGTKLPNNVLVKSQAGHLKNNYLFFEKRK